MRAPVIPTHLSAVFDVRPYVWFRIACKYLRIYTNGINRTGFCVPQKRCDAIDTKLSSRHQEEGGRTEFNWNDAIDGNVIGLCGNCFGFQKVIPLQVITLFESRPSFRLVFCDSYKNTYHINLLHERNVDVPILNRTIYFGYGRNLFSTKSKTYTIDIEELIFATAIIY